MAARLPGDIIESSFFRPCRAVGAIRCKRVPDIGDRKNACAQGDLFTLQPLGIAAAIPYFMVAVRDFQGRPQVKDRFEHF